MEKKKKREEFFLKLERCLGVGYFIAREYDNYVCVRPMPDDKTGWNCKLFSKALFGRLFRFLDENMSWYVSYVCDLDTYALVIWFPDDLIDK